jgi:hypothetical protein
MTEWSITEYLLQTRNLLHPLQSDSVLTTPESLAGADAMLTTFLKGKPMEQFLFLVEIKSKSTPQIIHNAIAQIKTSHERKHDPAMHPMIVVPYLSEERLQELEEAGVCGIDLCGNGIVNIPDRLTIFRTGNQNLYPDARPVSNPFQGKSAMVARAFFSEPVFINQKSKFDTLGELQQAIIKAGTPISLSQVSKAVSALEERRLIGSEGRALYLLNPDQILAKLASAWKLLLTPPTYLKLGENRMKKLKKLNESPDLKWAISGESSATHYIPFAQGGAIQIAVSNLSKAIELLEGEEERVPNFADLELRQTDEPGYFFANQVDDHGIRWASLLQTWIELHNGDARQQDAARAIRNLIIAPSNS